MVIMDFQDTLEEIYVGAQARSIRVSKVDSVEYVVMPYDLVLNSMEEKTVNTESTLRLAIGDGAIPICYCLSDPKLSVKVVNSPNSHGYWRPIVEMKNCSECQLLVPMETIILTVLVSKKAE